MLPSDHASVVGFAGVAVLLVAFLLNSIGVLRSDGAAYLVLNIVGAAVAGYSSYLISFMPFVVLEGAWVLVATAALLRAMSRRSSAASEQRAS